jgi:ribosomal-protein-alanine N-acetyltransferase
MLEGKTVNLRVVEKEDVDFLVDWTNNPNFWGEYCPIDIFGQTPKAEWMKLLDNPSDFLRVIEIKRFVIEKKDGTRIGVIWHMVNQPYNTTEINCFLVPSERGKRYGTEAVQLMVDYLFLSKNIIRIEAKTNVANKASQRVLEKAGFSIEGTIRKLEIVRGVWTDHFLHSILREEWKEPKILTKTT